MKTLKHWLISALAGGALTGSCFAEPPPTARYHFVDLSPHHARTWDGYIPSWEWSPPARGLQTLNDTPFELSGVVQFLGLAQARRGRSHSMSGSFPVNRKFTEAHLLHFTHFEGPFGQPTALIVFHYEEGEPYRHALRYGVEFLNWYHHRGGPVTMGETTTCVWMAPVPQSPERRQVTGLWHTALPNPHPDRMVKAIEVESLFGNAGYTLAGITLEQGEPRPAPAEALPGRQLPPVILPARRSLLFVDEETGGPLTAGTGSVWFKMGANAMFWGNHEIGADGRMTFPVPPGLDLPLEIIAAGTDHVPTRFTAPRQAGLPSREGAPFELKRGRVIGGLVRDGSGEPVPGATVLISGVMGGPDGGFTLFPWPAVRTDANGTWSIGAAPDDFRGISFSVSHPDFQPVEYEAGTDDSEPYLISPAKLLKREAEMELTRGITLAGRVVDQAGQAVAEARVAYFAGDDVQGVQRRAVTDAAGNFALPNARPGYRAIIVSAPGHAPSIVHRDLQPNQEPWRVELKPAVPLKLKLVDGEGRPVAGAYVLLPEWRDLRWNDWMQRSGPDGLITWPEPPLEHAGYFITGPDVMAKVVQLSPGEETRAIKLESMRE